MPRFSVSAALVVALAAATTTAAAPVATQVEAQGPANVLRGTMLSLADAPKAPVVLIIPGSGPTDRDGNSPLGVKAASYRLLAEGLAADGVASVRVDKRGMFASAAPNVDGNHVTMADYAADVHAWAAEIRRETGAPCVWAVGHSEGALAALVAAQNPKDICGVVLVAGAGRPLAEILREQLKANPANAPLLPQALPAIDALAAGRHVDVTGMNPALLPLFSPKVQDFLIDEMAYDPAKLVAAYAGPVLVLQGTTDLQTSMADAERLAAARPGVRLIRLDGVNHMLKAAPADRAGQMATYADPDLPLAPGVASAIADFVKTNPPR
ncbi:MAG TPA: alpha/beta fold hydrolase [Caulobacteraceae bacterium]|nr:alpha/beta fold hydrolase [Caulobacteraceae bacterium]